MVPYLQQASQLAVPVVDVLGAVLVAQSVDAVAQSQEGAVNVGPLLQPLTSVLSLSDREKRMGMKTASSWCLNINKAALRFRGN